MHEEVFKLRVRAHEDSDSTKDIDGHGLGLYLVREAVEKIGGKVEMTSEEGKGTSFTLTLPKNCN